MEIIGQNARIEKVAESEYEFHFDKYISEGWSAFKKAPMQLIVFTLIVLAVSILISFFPIVGSIALLFISPALTAGYYVGFKKLDETGIVEIGDFFKAFDDIVQLFLFALVSGLLIGLGMILLVLPGIWLAIAILFGYPLVALAKIEFWDAIQLSVRIISKKWFHFLGLLIVLSLINLLGVLFLGVGLFITIPFSYGVLYSAYKDIVGFSESEKQDVIDHLVDDRF